MCNKCVEYSDTMLDWTKPSELAHAVSPPEPRSELTEIKQKLFIIERVDWIKNELLKLDNRARFIETIGNVIYAKDIERIMKVPFRMAKYEYLKLVNRRNDICHKFTQRGLRQ